ncbi:glycohydrolase toxin TNT-related protein [Amycolatopsis palatopharyngis]|uniref:glycohydrolase toxin TNT-related protein n=1 Tax=Amycolatopsis palatopharyngis TaxID=187982 RepID=UPI000E2395EE|nr:glycohydrolase toxin TNT-related protein [Amycolatopsis palatopharyngis]
MAQATQLNATEQDTLVKQIGLSLLRAAPRDWQRVTAEYRAVGRFHELNGEIVLADGSTVDWVATHDIATLFGRLRAGMYREGRGTWFNARYQLDHPSSYNLEYDREEPRWDLMPPPQAYADELRMFPRSEDNVPEWLMRRMSGLGPERPGPRFRIARIFDGAGPGGRPVINRPELEVDEQDRLLEYLDAAPVVVPNRGYDIDRLASTPEGTVPVAFHSDGVWIWPAAVNYYLREYGVSPEPDLIQHIHASGFAVPAVPDQLRQAAAAHINRGAPPPRQAPPPVPPPVTPPQAEGHTERVPARQTEEPQQPEPAPVQAQTPPQSPYEEEFDQTTYAEPVVDGRGFADRGFTEPAQTEPGQDDTQVHESGFDQYDEYDTESYDEPDYQHDQQTAGSTDADQAQTDQMPDAGSHRALVDPPTTFTPAASMDPGPMTTITPSVPTPPAASERHPAEVSGPGSETQRQDPQHAETEYAQTEYAGFDHTGFDHPGFEHTGFDHAGASPAESQHPEAQHPEAQRTGLGQPEPQPGGHRADFDDGGPPTQIGGVPLPEHAEPVLDQLQDTLRQLGVPDGDYRIGEPAERGWSVEEVPDGWRVGWYEGELTNPAVFGDPEDAAAFMLGKLLLAPDGGVSGTQPPPAATPESSTPQPQSVPPAPPQPPQAPPASAAAASGAAASGAAATSESSGQAPAPAQSKQAPLLTTLSPEIATGSRPQHGQEAPQSPARPATPAQTSPAPGARDEAPAQALPPQGVAANGSGAAAPPARPAQTSGASGGAPGAGQQWPIQPMEGEPPLTLFRGKEVRELPAGSELDRFGGPNGNLTYAAGTPFEERSLVPEWVNRPYHVYRVQRPLESLAGVAIPWFNQPGGGAAYLLPASIEELVAEGDLIELEPGEPPVS